MHTGLNSQSVLNPRFMDIIGSLAATKHPLDLHHCLVLSWRFQSTVYVCVTTQATIL